MEKILQKSVTYSNKYLTLKSLQIIRNIFVILPNIEIFRINQLLFNFSYPIDHGKNSQKIFDFLRNITKFDS